jgi:hypothetical protein
MTTVEVLPPGIIERELGFDPDQTFEPILSKLATPEDADFIPASLAVGKKYHTPTNRELRAIDAVNSAFQWIRDIRHSADAREAEFKALIAGFEDSEGLMIRRDVLHPESFAPVQEFVMEHFADKVIPTSASLSIINRKEGSIDSEQGGPTTEVLRALNKSVKKNGQHVLAGVVSKVELYGDLKGNDKKYIALSFDDCSGSYMADERRPYAESLCSRGYQVRKEKRYKPHLSLFLTYDSDVARQVLAAVQWYIPEGTTILFDSAKIWPANKNNKLTESKSSPLKLYDPEVTKYDPGIDDLANEADTEEINPAEIGDEDRIYASDDPYTQEMADPKV